jgi:hypothetical protein
MDNYKKLMKLAEELIEGDCKLDKKHTKAESARQRKRINSIQKLAIQAKRELMLKDGEA